MRVLCLLCLSSLCLADSFQNYGRYSPHDYVFRSNDTYEDPIFDQYRTVDLGADVGVGSDCGRIDFKNTLRASLQNVLDTKYFGDLGKNIIASSPMLLACYFSPTWCAILKHSQISAHYLSQLRLDQCSIVDKYVDSRVEDYYQERQGCVRKSIEQNGGDLEHAMESCQGNRLWDAKLTNWAGKKFGDNVSENRLLENSAKWAGFTTPDSHSTLNLVKGLVGDTVLGHGSVSVEYGPRQTNLTARTYLRELERDTYKTLCDRFMKRVSDNPNASPDMLISDDEIKGLTAGLRRPLIDRQTLRSLAVMPERQRREACKSLSECHGHDDVYYRHGKIPGHAEHPITEPQPPPSAQK